MRNPFAGDDIDPEVADEQLALAIKDGYEMACPSCDQFEDEDDNCGCPRFEPTGTAEPEWEETDTE